MGTHLRDIFIPTLAWHQYTKRTVIHSFLTQLKMVWSENLIAVVILKRRKKRGGKWGRRQKKKKNVIYECILLPFTLHRFFFIVLYFFLFRLSFAIYSYQDNLFIKTSGSHFIRIKDFQPLSQFFLFFPLSFISTLFVQKK